MKNFVTLGKKYNNSRKFPKNTLRASFSEESHVLVLLWGQIVNGNRRQIPTPYFLKRGNPSLLMLKTLWTENFIKCRWLMCHTIFTLVTLFTKLCYQYCIFNLKAFQQRSSRKRFEKEKQNAHFSFSVAVIGHNIHCFGRKGFRKVASFWVFLN